MAFVQVRDDGNVNWDCSSGEWLDGLEGVCFGWREHQHNLLRKDMAWVPVRKQGALLVSALSKRGVMVAFSEMEKTER